MVQRAKTPAPDALHQNYVQMGDLGSEEPEEGKARAKAVGAAGDRKQQPARRSQQTGLDDAHGQDVAMARAK